MCFIYCLLADVYVSDNQLLSMMPTSSNDAQSNDAKRRFAHVIQQFKTQNILLGTNTEQTVKPSELIKVGKQQAVLQGRLIMIFLLFLSNMKTFRGF